MSGWVLAGTGGVLIGISFLWTLGWVVALAAYVPLFLLVARAREARAALLQAFTGLLIATAIALHWVAFHPFPRTAAASVLALPYLALVAALPVGPAVWATRRAGTSVGAVVLLGGFLLAEWWLTAGPLAFPWLLAGHTQAVGPLAAGARWAGVPGLSLWVLGVNGLLSLALLRQGAPMQPALGLAVLGAVGVWFAAVPAADERREQPVPSSTIGIVQPALDPLLWANEAAPQRADVLTHLTDSLLAATGDLDLVIWPETAVWMSSEAEVGRRTVPLLTGAIDRADGAFQNQALLLPPASSASDRPDIQRYVKQHLVPFAEAVPFADRWPWLHRLAVPSGGVAGYARGDQATLLRTRELTVGALICFESLFGNTARQMAEEGADVLVVLAQNGWWGASAGVAQHRAFSRLRAFETGRPVVYAAVAGGSTVWDARGRTLLVLDWMERHAATSQVAGPPLRTPYLRHGNLVSPTALALWLLLLAGVWYRSRRSVSRPFRSASPRAS